ncbi:MAG TPA: S41 family peptidase [Magnetospirillaceae bacterium]|nr:S41 family peptidase [Magnetospirillaceae bacterium]
MQKTGDIADSDASKAIVIKKRRSVGMGTAVLVSVAIAIGAFVLGTRLDGFIVWLKGGQSAQLADTLDFSSLQEVYKKLRGTYDGKLDAQVLIDGAKKGLVSAAGDPYTVYFTDAEAKQFSDDLDGKFSGIGAEIGTKNNNLIIVSTLDDSPARKAGLQTDDIIAKVNDEETTGWSIDQAVSKIRGQKDTTVKLTVVRNQQLKEFSIVRDNIVNPSVRFEITPENIGYLRISRFAEDTDSLAQKAANEFVSKGVKGVILDLRGDGGGYLTTAQQVAGLWLPTDKTIVEERVGDSVKDTLKADGTAPLKGIPTVVLIDGGSASASEIVAGALSDHKVAQLVGTKTYGKGSVQELLNLTMSGQLKVTIAKWYTPNGKNINKEGIAPDIEVKPTDEQIAASEDVQKAKAIDLLKK